MIKDKSKVNKDYYCNFTYMMKHSCNSCKLGYKCELKNSEGDDNGNKQILQKSITEAATNNEMVSRRTKRFRNMR